MERETQPRDAACESARRSASLRLDVELSEVERELLERHLARCRACAVFDAEIRALAHAMRAAPAEVPSLRWQPREPAAATRRRRRTLVSLVAAALLLGVLFGSLRSEPAPAPAEPSLEIGLLTEDTQDLRHLPRGGQRSPEPRPRDDQEIPRFPAVRT